MHRLSAPLLQPLYLYKVQHTHAVITLDSTLLKPCDPRSLQEKTSTRPLVTQINQQSSHVDSCQHQNRPRLAAHAYTPRRAISLLCEYPIYCVEFTDTRTRRARGASPRSVAQRQLSNLARKRGVAPYKSTYYRTCAWNKRRHCGVNARVVVHQRLCCARPHHSHDVRRGSGPVTGSLGGSCGGLRAVGDRAYARGTASTHKAARARRALCLGTAAPRKGSDSGASFSPPSARVCRRVPARSPVL